MSTSLSEDDLGDLLRGALQDVSPLATDPVPPPAFALADVAAPLTSGPADAVELDTRRPVRRRRRVVVAAGVLVAAAAVAGVVVLTSDLPASNRSDGVAGTAASSSSPSPSPSPYDGVRPYPVPWRCVTPAGSPVTASETKPSIHGNYEWTPGSDTTCAARPQDSAYFEDMSVVSPLDPDEIPPGGEFMWWMPNALCTVVGTQPHVDSNLAVVSLGLDHYIEFYGEDCRLMLPEK